MKFTVITEGEDKPIVLSLQLNREGTIADVCGEMPDGMSFTILSLHQDGSFVRHSGLPADAGFQLTESDENGVGRQIVEVGLDKLHGCGQLPIEGLLDRITIRGPMASTAIHPTDPVTPAGHYDDEHPEPLDYDEDGE